MNEQTEAERQASEKAVADHLEAEKRTAEVGDRFNRILRGQPTKEAQHKPSKAEKRLVRLAAAGDKEAAQMLADWQEARKPAPTAGERFNESIRMAARLPKGSS